MKKLLTILFSVLLITSSVSASQTLWEHYDRQGLNLPSVDDRSVLYKNIADDLYRGGYSQNIALLAYLKGDMLGFAPSTGYSERLTSSITTTATTIPVSSVLDADDITLPCSATNKCYFNIEAGTVREERVVCAGITGSSLTSCTRGLVATGISEVASSTLYKAHNAGSRIIMTNIAQFFGNYVDTTTAQTVAGVKTFSSLPKVPTDTPTENEELASWGVISNLVNQGGATSTESVAGISELATRTEMASSTDNGADRPLVLQTKYSTSSPDVRGVNVVVSENDGYIDSDWLGFSDTEEVMEIGTTTQWSNYGGLMPSGSITAYASSTSPTGWLACDGSAISSTTYASLFSIIGQTYGSGDGITTGFNLPDLSGRNVIGYGSATSTFDTMGETGGEDEHLLSDTESGLPVHDHTLKSNTGLGDADAAANNYLAGKESSSSGLLWDGSTNTNNTVAIGDSTAQDAASAHNIMDPFIVLQYIIKY